MILGIRQDEIGVKQGPAPDQAIQLGPIEQNNQPPRIWKIISKIEEARMRCQVHIIQNYNLEIKMERWSVL